MTDVQKKDEDAERTEATPSSVLHTCTTTKLPTLFPNLRRRVRFSVHQFIFLINITAAAAAASIPRAAHIMVYMYSGPAYRA